MIQLMRRYAYGFVNSHDFAVPLEIMSEDYTLHVGTETLIGRDTRYLPAVRHAFEQFPTLTYSIHELVSDGVTAAVLFTEHGKSSRQPDRAASWIGVGIYRAEGDRLVECWVEQDHYGKRRQLDSGISDPVQPVALDPWTPRDATPAGSADAERVVRRWLDGLVSWPPESSQLDAGQGQSEQIRLRVTGTSLEVVVAEGSRVGFNAGIRGVYEGGIPGFDARIGDTVQTWVGAIGDLTDGAVVNLRGASNRVAIVRGFRAVA